jgi:hypothetical protein
LIDETHPFLASQLKSWEKISGIYVRVIGELMVDDMLFYSRRYFWSRNGGYRNLASRNLLENGEN